MASSVREAISFYTLGCMDCVELGGRMSKTFLLLLWLGLFGIYLLFSTLSTGSLNVPQMLVGFAIAFIYGGKVLAPAGRLYRERRAFERSMKSCIQVLLEDWQNQGAKAALSAWRYHIVAVTHQHPNFSLSEQLRVIKKSQVLSSGEKLVASFFASHSLTSGQREIQSFINEHGLSDQASLEFRAAIDSFMDISR